MSERVEALDLSVQWDSNDPRTVMLSDDEYGFCGLGLRPHPDDPDRRAVVLRWSKVMHAQIGSPNDEALQFHRLFGAGLDRVLWAGLVHDSTLVQQLRRMWSPRPDPWHYIVKTKESVAEVVAASVTVLRLEGTTQEACSASLSDYRAEQD
jgi:hypothetical protein